MNNLSSVVRPKNLTHIWYYRDALPSEPFSAVARYDDGGKKKWFHQYQCVNGKWTEGAPTPLPIYGLHLLQDHNPEENIFIFEGEKCTEAAHQLNLTALTSMMGACQADKANWSALAQYTQHRNYVLIPDHDEPGNTYMRSVFEEIKRACPLALIQVCILPVKNKGDDLIDWIRLQSACPEHWDGFKPIDEPASLYLKNAFKELVSNLAIPAEAFFTESSRPVFIGPFEPIEDSLLPVKECPVHEFPEEIDKWITAYADQMQVPVDYLAVPLLVYIGSIIGKKRGIKVRQGIDWVEFPNLWGMIIGRPSLMKSPAMKAMQQPLASLINRARVKYEESKLQYVSLHDKWRILKKAQEDQFKKAIESKIKNKDEIHLHKLGDIKIEQEPKAPLLKRYRTDDATIEKLGELLIENPQGILLFRDELSGFLYGFEKSGRENDRQFFLESWSGKGDFHVDRISRGSLYVPSLCISIMGSIQPGPLMRYIKAAVKGGAGDDGFIQRFQIMVWPEVTDGWQLMKSTPLHDLEEKVLKIFDRLDRLDFDSTGRPILLEFDTAAQAIFDDWQTRLERRLRSNEMPSYFEAHLAKYKKLVPVVSLISELIWAASNEKQSAKVKIDSIEKAISWAEYLESHAEKIYSSSVNRVTETAQSLLQRIKRGQLKEPFTVRDVYHGKHWSGLASPEEVQEVIDYLCEYNYLSQQRVKTGGKSTIKYWVHPDIFK